MAANQEITEQAKPRRFRFRQIWGIQENISEAPGDR
jgi:hypothetical protein